MRMGGGDENGPKLVCNKGAGRRMGGVDKMALGASFFLLSLFF
jgi:hypothetical protein